MAGTQKREQDLSEWTAGIVDRPSVELHRQPGGGRHEAWSVTDGHGGHWFLRTDRYSPGAHEHYTLRREAGFYRAAGAAGIPVPAVLAVHPTLEAVLLEHADGVATLGGLDLAARHRVIDNFAEVLAQLHRADPATLSLGQPVRSIAEHVIDELDIWESRLDSVAGPEPFLTACFAYLRAHLPDTDDRPALVQGDTGPGNFLHDGDRVTAVLDFELAHLGDPMEDLAWVGTRHAQEPLPDFDRFLRGYAAAAGREPDPERIRFHAVFAELRIAVLAATGADDTDEGRADSEKSTNHLMADLGNGMIYGALHRRLTVEAMASLTETPLPSVPLPPLADTKCTPYYDGVLAQLRDIVGPQVADPFANRRLKGAARVLKYLREADRAGTADEEAEMTTMTNLLGHRPASVREGAAQLVAKVRQGRLDAIDLLPLAAARSAAEHQLMAPAMGALATRHLPDV